MSRVTSGPDGPGQRTAYYEHAQREAEARIDDGESLGDVIFDLAKSLNRFDVAQVQASCKHVPWMAQAWRHRCMYCGAVLLQGTP
jgi:hypothetical protein